MKIGDLVEHRSERRRNKSRVGVIVEIQVRGDQDYRSQDSFLVMWSDRYEWAWKSEIRILSDFRYGME